MQRTSTGQAIAPNPTLRFGGCALRYVSFVKVNLRRTVFRACKAGEANFIDCQLGESDFGETDLTGANFEASDLSKANLAAAEGAFLAPGKNRVKDARILAETAVFMAVSQDAAAAKTPGVVSPRSHLIAKDAVAFAFAI